MSSHALHKASAATNRSESGRRFAAWVLCLLAFSLTIVPVAVFVVRVLGAPRPTAGPVADPVLAHAPWALYASSLGWAAGVGGLATAAAWPVAWAARRRPWLVAACMIPLALPNYLCYAALNLARAPRTLVGDWIQRLAASDPDWQQLPLAAGRIIAGLSLVLWIWPLAFLAMLPAIRSISDETLDQLDLDSQSLLTRLALRMQLARGGLYASIAATIIVILGSPVPLHVAQVPTASMAVWVGLVQDPGNPRHWLTGWPLVLIAGFAAALLGRWLVHPPVFAESASETTRHRESRPWRLWPLAASTILPLVLLTGALHEWASIPRFMHLESDSLGFSLLIGCTVATGSLVLGCLVWFVAGTASERLGIRQIQAVGIIACFAAATLSPGVMVGAALARALPAMLWTGIEDTPVPLVAAHLVRYAAVMMIACMLLRRAEPVDLGDCMRLDGAEGVYGFLTTRVWPNRLPLLGAWLFTCSLSVHDIDTSIMVLPPGSQSLAERMLGFLHFAKTEELSAGSIIFESAGLLTGLLIYTLARIRDQRIQGNPM